MVRVFLYLLYCIIKSYFFCKLAFLFIRQTLIISTETNANQYAKFHLIQPKYHIQCVTNVSILSLISHFQAVNVHFVQMNENCNLTNVCGKDKSSECLIYFMDKGVIKPDVKSKCKTYKMSLSLQRHFLSCFGYGTILLYS